MSHDLRIAVAQINLWVTDIDRNAERIIECVRQAVEQEADVVVFPELTLSGYLPEDLLMRPELQRSMDAAMARILANVGDIYAVIGLPEKTQTGLYNAACVVHRHKIIATYYKQCLPNYGVFDEKRYFKTGTHPCVVDMRGHRIAITICEDLWHLAQPSNSAPSSQSSSSASTLHRTMFKKLRNASKCFAIAS